MFKNKVITIASLSIAIMLFLSACGGAVTEIDLTTTEIGEVTEVTVVTTVEATGSITPLREAMVTWKISGTIMDVNVKVGQQVRTDDILMSLDPESLPDNLITAMNNLTEMTSPRAIASAQKAVVDAAELVDEMQDERDGLNTVFTQAVIDNAYATMVLAEDRLATAQDRFNEVDHLDETDPSRATAYQSLYDAQYAYDSAKRSYEYYESYSASDNDLALADANLALAKAQLEEAENYLAALTGGDVPADATGNALQQLNQTRRTVDQVNLLAPFDGTVGAVYSQQYDVVSANTRSVLILNRSSLFLTVPVEEIKVVQLSIGDKATLTLDALPDLTGLTGKVISIDPVGTDVQGVVYYDVMVELDQNDPQIILDATANVTIQAGDARQMLAVPVEAVQNDSQGEYVLVYNSDDSTRRVDVVSGKIQADDTVVVEGDLQAGDQVMKILVKEVTDPGGMFMPPGR